LEQPRRSTLADHVHRPSQLGPSVLINESWYKAGSSCRRRRGRAAEEREAARGQARGCPHCGGQSFESPPVHQQVRARAYGTLAFLKLAEDEKDVSARPADRAHHDGGDRRQPKRQSLFGPRHSEQRQTKSVYDDENVFRNLLNNVGSRRDRPCGGGGGRRPVLSSGEDTTRFFGGEDASGGWNAKNVLRAPGMLLLAASEPLFFCC
jgi:hypothetical protein